MSNQIIPVQHAFRKVFNAKDAPSTEDVWRCERNGCVVELSNVFMESHKPQFAEHPGTAWRIRATRNGRVLVDRFSSETVFEFIDSLPSFESATA